MFLGDLVLSSDWRVFGLGTHVNIIAPIVVGSQFGWSFVTAALLSVLVCD